MHGQLCQSLAVVLLAPGFQIFFHARSRVFWIQEKSIHEVQDKALVGD